jgi:hypothetical protein
MSFRWAMSRMRVRGTDTVKESAKDGRFCFKLRMMKELVSEVSSLSRVW